MTALAPELAASPSRPAFSAAVYGWSVLLLSLHVVLATLLLPWSLAFDRDRRLAARLGAALTRFGIRRAPEWRELADALAAVDLSRPAVVVMNHRSLADIAIAVGVAGAPRIVSKPWVGRLPLLGLNMRLCGHVVFDPESPRSVRRMIERLETLLARGESVLVFPEGTRRTERGLGTFHEGAFRVAVAAGVDVLPIVLHGTGELVPKGSWLFRDVPIAMTALPRIPPGRDRRELARRVRAAMGAALAIGPRRSLADGSPPSQVRLGA